MRTLKLLFSGIAALLSKAWQFPRWLVRRVRLHRRDLVLNALEAERLDRIRHPSKYLGK